MTTLFYNAKIVTLDEAEPVIDRGYVVVKDTKIEKVGRGSATEIPSDRDIDCSGKVIMPGLYNIHTHLPMTCLRSYAEGLPLQQWLNERIFPAEDKLNPDLVYYASMMGMLEMVRGGTVSFSDLYFFCETIAEAAADIGMKGNIAKTCVCFDETGADDGGRLDNALELYKNLHGANDGKIRIDLGIHAAYSVNEPYLKRVAKRIEKMDDLRIHFHLCETPDEADNCVEKTGKRPLALFDDAGLLAHPGIAAHCVHITRDEMERLKEAGITVAHNPTSNLKLGNGIADVAQMEEVGVHVGLGSDGCASNNNQNLFEELHLASLLQKGKYFDPTKLSPLSALRMATINGAIAQGRKDCGLIREGWAADLLLIDFNKPHLFPSHDVLASLCFSAQASDVALTMVDGKILCENGEFTTVDFEDIKRGLQFNLSALPQ